MHLLSQDALVRLLLMVLIWHIHAPLSCRLMRRWIHQNLTPTSKNRQKHSRVVVLFFLFSYLDSTSQLIIYIFFISKDLITNASISTYLNKFFFYINNSSIVYVCGNVTVYCIFRLDIFVILLYTIVPWDTGHSSIYIHGKEDGFFSEQ